MPLKTGFCASFGCISSLKHMTTKVYRQHNGCRQYACLWKTVLNPAVMRTPAFIDGVTMPEWCVVLCFGGLTQTRGCILGKGGLHTAWINHWFTVWIAVVRSHWQPICQGPYTFCIITMVNNKDAVANCGIFSAQWHPHTVSHGVSLCPVINISVASRAGRRLMHDRNCRSLSRYMSTCRDYEHQAADEVLHSGRRPCGTVQHLLYMTIASLSLSLSLSNNLQKRSFKNNSTRLFAILDVGPMLWKLVHLKMANDSVKWPVLDCSLLKKYESGSWINRLYRYEAHSHLRRRPSRSQIPSTVHILPSCRLDKSCIKQSSINELRTTPLFR